MSTFWPGTYEGCSCSSTNTQTIGACTPSQLSGNCKTVPSTVPFSMNVWRGRIMCIKRAGTSAYWAPVPDFSTGTCPSKTDIYGNTVNFVMCGTGDIAICQEETIGCPINRIQWVAPQGNAPDYAGNLIFGDGYQLYYDYGNSQSTDAPVIDFAISQGNVCLQNPGDEGNSSETYYSLLKQKPSGCTYYDARFTTLDTENEVEFYKDNDLQNITTALPGFNINPYNVYHLSARTSILWKQVCREHYYSQKSLNDNKEPMKYILALHIVVLVIESVFSAYLVFGDPLLLYFCYKRSEEEINEYDQPIYSILVIEKILKLILIPVVLTTCIIVGYFRNWYANLENRCCSDPTTNASFGFVDYILDDLYKLDWANFSIIVVVLIIDMISALCLFVSRTKENYS